MKHTSSLIIALALTLNAFVAAIVSYAGEKSVARVDGKEISETEMQLAESEVGTDLANIPPEQRRVVLVEYLIENHLLAAAAENEKLGSGPEFENRLKYYKRRALRDAYFDKMVRGAVSESDAKQIYDSQISNMKPETEVRARHILVEEEQKARKIIAQLAKGEDFAELAKKNSKGPSAAKGGDLGYFSRGRMVKVFEDAAFSLKAGEISEPVKSEFGWHVIKVEDKRDRPLPSFDDVKDRILASLIQRKTQEVLSSLRNAAKIEILDPKLKEQHKALQERLGGR